MSEHQAERSAHYKRTREAFDGLKIEDKAIFLVEAAVATVARGVEQAGRVLAHELDAIFERLSDLGRPPEDEDLEEDDVVVGAPVPPTETKAAPKTATPKKRAPKKTTAPRKRSTAKKQPEKPDQDEGAPS
jgi:hypothetical protein